MNKKKNYLTYKTQLNHLNAPYKILTHTVWPSTEEQQKTYSSLKLEGIQVYLMKLNLIKMRFFRSFHARFFQSSTTLFTCTDLSLYGLLRYLTQNTTNVYPLIAFINHHPINYLYLAKISKMKHLSHYRSPQSFALTCFFVYYSRFFFTNPIWKFLFICRSYAYSKST